MTTSISSAYSRAGRGVKRTSANQHLANQHVANQHVANQHLANQHLASSDASAKAMTRLARSDGAAEWRSQV